MSNIVSVDPLLCKMWHLHDRLEHLIVEDTCRAEIHSFAKHGQLVAALGRPVRADPDNDVELICGARRLFVARHLNVQLLVEVREMTDRAAVIARDIENRWGPDLAAALHDIKNRRPSPARESSRPSCRALRLSMFINNWSPHRFQAGGFGPGITTKSS